VVLTAETILEMPEIAAKTVQMIAAVRRQKKMYMGLSRNLGSRYHIEYSEN